jgi:hypothetical protein
MSDLILSSLASRFFDTVFIFHLEVSIICLNLTFFAFLLRFFDFASVDIPTKCLILTFIFFVWSFLILQTIRFPWGCLRSRQTNSNFFNESRLGDLSLLLLMELSFFLWCWPYRTRLPNRYLLSQSHMKTVFLNCRLNYLICYFFCAQQDPTLIFDGVEKMDMRQKAFFGDCYNCLSVCLTTRLAWYEKDCRGSGQLTVLTISWVNIILILGIRDLA